MNENNAQEAQDQANRQGQEASQSGAGGSTRKVRGDGSATLARLNERQRRAQAANEKLAQRIKDQEGRVKERQSRASVGSAKAINSGSDASK